MGFEPTNNGFAIRPLGPLGYAANTRARVGKTLVARSISEWAVLRTIARIIPKPVPDSPPFGFGSLAIRLTVSKRPRNSSTLPSQGNRKLGEYNRSARSGTPRIDVGTPGTGTIRGNACPRRRSNCENAIALLAILLRVLPQGVGLG